MSKLEEIASYLLDGEENIHEVVKVTESIKPDLSLDEAYQVQDIIVERKLAQGHKIVGPKMGLTSRAKWEQMGVDKPVYGYLFDYMVINDGEYLELSDLIHPKAEAEIAFLIGEDIEGPGVTTAEVMAKTQAVLPAIEIIDSRFLNFNFTLTDVVADNASSARVVFGSKLTCPRSVDLGLIGTVLSLNGEVREVASSAAVLGHPAHAISYLANMLAKRGQKIHAGELILAGSITSAQLLSKGDYVEAKFDQLGSVSFHVK